MAQARVEGLKFGRLTVVKRTRKTSYKHWYVEVICDCGTVKEVKLYHLTGGKIVSCGCYNDELKMGNTHAAAKHGMVGTRTHRAWRDMKDRCLKSSRVAEYYSEKGITVCKRWGEFEQFYEDMGECPEGMTLDRIDNDKGYEPGNCRWVDRHMQSANTRVLRSSNTSGYRGVGWSKVRGKWRAYIQVRKKFKDLGMFSDINDAARAYNAEAIKHEGYPLNDISEATAQ